MILILIAILILVVVFISYQANNITTTLLWRISLVGIAFLLLIIYVIFSGKGIDSIEQISDATQTFLSWLSNAGTRITSYVSNQEWLEEDNRTGIG